MMSLCVLMWQTLSSNSSKSDGVFGHNSETRPPHSTEQWPVWLILIVFQINGMDRDHVAVTVIKEHRNLAKKDCLYFSHQAVKVRCVCVSKKPLLQQVFFQMQTSFCKKPILKTVYIYCTYVTKSCFMIPIFAITLLHHNEVCFQFGDLNRILSFLIILSKLAFR